MRIPLTIGLLLCMSSPFWAYTQNDFYNNGGSVYVQGGGLIHVNGEVVNDNEAANVGRMYNSGTIQLTGNWTNTATSNVFQALDAGTTILIGNNALQTIGGTADTYFNNLSFAKPGGTREVRLLRNSLCDGTLSLSDDFLNTQSFIFGVANANPSAIQRTGPIVSPYTNSLTEGYVTSTVGSTGRLSRATSNAFPGGRYLFPVGTATRFRPVEIVPTSIGNNAYSVQFVDAATFSTNLKSPTLATINPAWYHFIERTIPVGSPESIRIYHDFTADDVCDINNVTIAEWNTTLWGDLGTVTSQQNASPTLSWTQKSNYPDLYPTPWLTNSFALAGLFIVPQMMSCVFPVELTELNAKPLRNSILVYWQVATQTSNSGWFVERSIDGRNFSNIGWVTGAGNSTVSLGYELEDKQVQPGVLYFYRLRQVDVSGAETLSQVVTAILPENGLSVGDLYPNPSLGLVYLPISLDDPANVEISIVNMLGQQVLSKSEMAAPGYQTLEFDLSRLAAGAYQVNIHVLGRRISKKLVLE